MKSSVKFTHRIRNLVLPLLLGLMLPACSTRPADNDDYEKATLPRMEKDKIEVVRRKLATSVRKLANRIDIFFAGKRVYEEVYDNYVQLNLLTLYQDTGEIGFDQNLQAKLVFPNTQKRWKLLIETDTERDIEGDGFVDDPISTVRKSNYSAGLRYIAKKTGDWNISFDAGALFVTPIDLFVRGRVRRHIKYNGWATRLAETLTAYGSARYIATTEIDFDRLINENRLFRYSTEINFLNYDTTVENVNFSNFDLIADWKQSASLYQRLDPRQAIQYQAGIIGVREPLHVRDYFVNVRYRRQLRRKWLFFEITPEYNWLERNNYERHFAVLLKFEAVITDN
jgi:hypothetical protein